MILPTDYPVKLFLTRKDWEDWLKHEHATNGVWIKFAKKGTGAASVTYDEALEIALCYGWIDGLTHKLDEKYYIIKFTPRGPRSMWSKRNCEIVSRLIQEGKMRKPGLEKIDAAKKDGRWDRAYESPKNMLVPEDFLKELAKDKKAMEFYKTLTRVNTYAIAFQLHTAKKPEIRERRFQKLLEMLKRGEKLH